MFAFLVVSTLISLFFWMNWNTDSTFNLIIKIVMSLMTFWGVYLIYAHETFKSLMG